MESSSSEEESDFDIEDIERDLSGRVMVFETIVSAEKESSEEEDQLYEWVTKKSMKNQVTIMLAALKEALF